MPSGVKMGFEGEIYYGVAGSTAGTKLTNSRDITYNSDPTKGETTVRGDGSAPPIETERVVSVKFSIEWLMLRRTDASLEALIAAAVVGTPVAIRTKDFAAGKGFDGDMTLSMKHGAPYKGEQTYAFTATVTDELRTPQPYV